MRVLLGKGRSDGTGTELELGGRLRLHLRSGGHHPEPCRACTQSCRGCPKSPVMLDLTRDSTQAASPQVLENVGTGRILGSAGGEVPVAFRGGGLAFGQTWPVSKWRWHVRNAFWSQAESLSMRSMRSMRLQSKSLSARKPAAWIGHNPRKDGG